MSSCVQVAQVDHDPALGRAVAGAAVAAAPHGELEAALARDRDRGGDVRGVDDADDPGRMEVDARRPRSCGRGRSRHRPAPMTRPRTRSRRAAGTLARAVFVLTGLLHEGAGSWCDGSAGGDDGRAAKSSVRGSERRRRPMSCARPGRQSGQEVAVDTVRARARARPAARTRDRRRRPARRVPGVMRPRHGRPAGALRARGPPAGSPDPAGRRPTSSWSSCSRSAA